MRGLDRPLWPFLLVALSPIAVTLYAGSAAGQALDPACNVSVYFVATGLVPMMLVLWTGSALASAVALHRGNRDVRAAG